MMRRRHSHGPIVVNASGQYQYHHVAGRPVNRYTPLLSPLATVCDICS